MIAVDVAVAAWKVFLIGVAFGASVGLFALGIISVFLPFVAIAAWFGLLDKDGKK